VKVCAFHVKNATGCTTVRSSRLPSTRQYTVGDATADTPTDTLGDALGDALGLWFDRSKVFLSPHCRLASTRTDEACIVNKPPVFLLDDYSGFSPFGIAQTRLRAATPPRQRASPQCNLVPFVIEISRTDRQLPDAYFSFPLCRVFQCRRPFPALMPGTEILGGTEAGMPLVPRGTRNAFNTAQRQVL
jgi:hypothetical protein